MEFYHMSLGLRDFRKQIVVISRDSFLFSASLRDNLDPYGDHTDQEILQDLGDFLWILLLNYNNLHLILSEKI